MPAQDEEVRVRLWARIDLDLGKEAYKKMGTMKRATWGEGIGLFLIRF